MTTIDTLFIHKLAVKTTIGVHAYEQKIKQTVLLDLELAYDSSIAAASDALVDAWDYAALVTNLQTMLATSQFNLIETLAHHICQYIFNSYPCSQLRLTIIKPQALSGSAQVGLTLTRTR